MFILCLIKWEIVWLILKPDKDKIYINKWFNSFDIKIKAK